MKLDLFAKQASRYASFRPHYPQKIVDWALSHAPKVKTSALDLGTGNGQIAVPLAQSGLFAHVTGVDQSAPQIEQAPKNVSNLSFEVSDIQDFLLKLHREGTTIGFVTAAQSAHWFVGDHTAWTSFKRNIRDVLQEEHAMVILGYRMCSLKDQTLRDDFEAFYKSTSELWNESCSRDVVDAAFEGVNWEPFELVDEIHMTDERVITAAEFLQYVGTWSAFTTDDSLLKSYREHLKNQMSLEENVVVCTPFFGKVLQ